MNAEFAPVLQRQMNAFNSDPPGDSLQVLTAAAYCICRQYERLLSEETNAYSAALKPFQYRMHPSVTIGIPFVVLDISPVPHIPVLYSTGHIVFCAIRQPTAVGVGLKHLSTTVVEDQFRQRMSHPGSISAVYRLGGRAYASWYRKPRGWIFDNSRSAACVRSGGEVTNRGRACWNVGERRQGSGEGRKNRGESPVDERLVRDEGIGLVSSALFFDEAGQV